VKNIKNQLAAGFSGQYGFTIIEVMLVLLILSVVVSMISLALSGTFEVINSTEKQGEIYNKARVAMQRISEDLSMAILHEDMVFSGARNEIDGRRADSLQFASMSHIVFDEISGVPGMARISYSLRKRSENTDDFVLLRSDILMSPQKNVENNEEDEATGFVLCDSLYSLEFTYYTIDGEQVEEWIVEKDNNEEKTVQSLPVMVRFTLIFRLSEDEDDTVTFSSSVILPTALIQPVASEESDDTA
jgi:prepilin-type N-terminal cleavage/methylation domain-containing protein